MCGGNMQAMVATHSHQSAPVVYIHGRSGWFAGDCSSHATTRKLANHMRNEYWYTKQYHVDYPPSNGVHAYLRSWRQLAGRDIARQIEERSVRSEIGVDVIAHSMGPLLLWEAAWQGVSCIRRVVLMSPAMDRGLNWDHLDFEQMLVMVNPGDRALFWGSMLPWHPYGRAGRKGFDVDDVRIETVEIRDKARSDIHRHSHYFKEPAIHEVGNIVDSFLTS
jgi:pimeloyl-ACP methyl ester carboxylesterase